MDTMTELVNMLGALAAIYNRLEVIRK